MAKKVTIKNPREKKDADAWVSKREGTVRMTIDLPAAVHAKLKVKSAKEYKKMKDIFIEAAQEYVKGVRI